MKRVIYFTFIALILIKYGNSLPVSNPKRHGLHHFKIRKITENATFPATFSYIKENINSSIHSGWLDNNTFTRKKTLIDISASNFDHYPVNHHGGGELYFFDTDHDFGDYDNEEILQESERRMLAGETDEEVPEEVVGNTRSLIDDDRGLESFDDITENEEDNFDDDDMDNENETFRNKGSGKLRDDEDDNSDSYKYNDEDEASSYESENSNGDEDETIGNYSFLSSRPLHIV